MPSTADCVKTLDAGSTESSIGFVLQNERRFDCELWTPAFDPLLGIAPVTFGSESDLRQRSRIVCFGSPDFHHDIVYFGGGGPKCAACEAYAEASANMTSIVSAIGRALTKPEKTARSPMLLFSVNAGRWVI